MTGPVALVTGAGSGIGRAVAVALAAEGYATVLCGRRSEPLEETARLCGPSGTALPVVADVADEASVAALFDRIRAEYGRLDLAFNNAGLATAEIPLEDLPVDLWRTVVDVNLTGAFLVTQQAFRLMKEQSPQGGRIINNGSISADAPRPMSIAYTATKHAVTGLTKSTSLDGRPYSIACGQINIGNAETEMTTTMKRGKTQADGSVRPEPVMPVDAVARAVVYMASLPLEANVQSLTVLATTMPYVGRG